MTLMTSYFPYTIHTEIHPVYYDKCFTKPSVHARCKKSDHGGESVVDEARPG